MSSIVIAGDTSGSVTLQAPAVAGTVVLTLPATSGTISTSSSQWTTTGSDIYYNSTGNVGIGAAPNPGPGSPYNTINIGLYGGGGIVSGGTDVYLTSNLYISGNNYFAYTGGSAYGSYYNQTGGNHTWKTSTAAGTGGNVATLNTLMTLNSNGALALFGGVSATGTGITFPATQSASSDANTLDDYEEGTWTPSVTLNSGTATTYSREAGTYTKTGRMVVCLGRVNPSNGTLGSTNGYIRMTGLPFTVGTREGAGSGGNMSNLNNGVSALFAYSTTADAATVSGSTLGGDYIFVVTYFV